MRTLYISTDIESDGPCPGKNSMLQLGSAVFDGKSEKPLATFEVNLELLPGASADLLTAEFWKAQPAAYARTRTNLKTPVNGMTEYAIWLKSLQAKLVFVGFPAAFDSLFTFWYLHTFAGENPFGWQALDLKTLAMAVLKVPYPKSTKRNYPAAWFGDAPHTHNGLDDAIEQGVMFTRMMAHAAIAP
jgi:hypothetical protein